MSLSVPLLPASCGLMAIVDEADAELVLGLKWYATTPTKMRGRPYVITRIKVDGRRTSIGLQRFLLNPPREMQVDHINGDTLDNRRCNLRLCSKSQNAKNRSRSSDNHSGFVGVFQRYPKPWDAYITVDGTRINLGPFATKEEAIAARRAAEAKYFGEFARGAQA